MGRRKKSSDGRFESYIKEIAAVLGHADRVAPMHDYCLGLVLPDERKSVEPMAAVTAGAGWRPAPIAAAFHRQRGVVGPQGPGQGAGDGSTRD